MIKIGQGSYFSKKTSAQWKIFQIMHCLLLLTFCLSVDIPVFFLRIDFHSHKPQSLDHPNFALSWQLVAKKYVHFDPWTICNKHILTLTLRYYNLFIQTLIDTKPESAHAKNIS